jgi:hypothetical protein
MMKITKTLKMSVLLVLIGCGQGVEVSKVQGTTTTAADDIRQCDGVAGNYVSQDGVQTLKISDCKMEFRAAYVSLPLEFDATFTATSQTGGWMFISISKSSGFSKGKEGDHSCTFSLNKGVLAMNCPDGILMQKFYSE